MKLKKNRIDILFGAIVLFWVWFSFFGCGENKAVAEPEQEQYDYQNLLILPVKNAAELHGEGQLAKCGICGSSFMAGPVSANAAAVVTSLLRSAIATKTKILYISEEQYQDMRSRILLGKKPEMTEMEIMIEVGLDLGADGVLTGNVYRFQERSGSDYAAEIPASIGIELDLIDTKLRAIRWNRRYEDTQRALSDNLLSVGSFLRRRGKWLTAEELADEGIQHLMKTIPIASKK